jgi:signal transduction histidine kinase
MDPDPVKVLLVEDDEDDYLLTRDLLAQITHARYALDWAASYDDALTRIASNHYDVWLLDYRLGAQSGLDLLRETIKQGYGVPVILLTGQGDREVDLQAMQSGAVDYLLKQEINTALLDRAIRYAIATKRHEQERLQLTLAQAAQTQAEAANHAKDEFLGIVAHELRNPLNAILTWVGVLQAPGIAPDVVAKALAAIERNVKQQARIIEDLLDITRIGQGALHIEKRPIDLATVVNTAVSTVRGSAAAKSIALEVTGEPALGPVAADPDRLQQVVINLLSNSIKFTPKRGRIEVRLERIEGSGGPQAQITVADTGQGIDATFLPQVFDHYRQAPRSPAGRQEGLGIGLAIVRSLVELHGGTVRAESPGEGLGATFIVRLPLIDKIS